TTCSRAIARSSSALDIWRGGAAPRASAKGSSEAASSGIERVDGLMSAMRASIGYDAANAMAASLLDALLAGSQPARSLLPPRSLDPGEWAARARAAAARPIARELADELQAQQAELPPSPARTANLAALTDGRAAACVTGQQVGLFGGPLYTIHKAASAVAW